MNGQERRNQIIKHIKESQTPISARKLADIFGVSRQIIVGDIALLRATGHLIDALPKGYVYNEPLTDYKSYQVIVKHRPEETKDELLAIVSCGVFIADVTIDHPTYGILKGELNIKSTADVKSFMLKDTPLLSSLTDGIHVHTLLYDDEHRLNDALSKLKDLGFLYID